MTRGKQYAVATSIFLLLFSITSAAAQPVDQGPEDRMPDNPREQAPEDISNKTGHGPLSQISGLGNNTMPDLPQQASDVAKSVKDTIGQVFNSAMKDIGSFLSDNLPIIGGPDTSDQPGDETNSTNSTQ